jgi:hypothetical protein
VLEIKIILVIGMLSLTCSALAIERKSADEVDINALTNETQIAQMLRVLRNYVVQADISPFGALRFFDKDTVMEGLQVQAIDASGKVRVILHRGDETKAAG